MSYASGDDSTNWILDSGSTHHMNSFNRAFNRSYDYLKNDISLKAAAILYIKGIKSVSLSTILWSNWSNGKYTTLITLQTDAFEII